MKPFDATEAAYKNGFAACAEKLRVFRPGDTVKILTKPKAKTGVITDWVCKDSYPDILYLVKIGKRDDATVASFSAEELELVSRPSYGEDEREGYEMFPAVLETERPYGIPFVTLHAEAGGEAVMLRADTIDTFTEGCVTTETGASWCVEESAEEIMGEIRKAWAGE